jgi:tRNA A-37 threonylcarbamoyl transferase component Bud32
VPFASSSTLTIDPGTAVGAFVVERALAQGTMSVLYLARDEHGERVVLKMLLPELMTSATRGRLMREARALAAVDHPGVVRVHGTGEHEGAPWIAMDYLRGTDLKRVLAERGPLSADVALQYAVQATEALVAAHDAGVIHRDLKPSNLLITPDGRVVLVDFGIAKRRSEAREGDVLTNAQEIIGTPAYLSPEQLEHGLADERSDVWSLGCVLYEMLAGVPPFGKGGSATIAAILRDEPEFPPRVPQGAVHVINACLRKSSFARVATAKELLAMLRDAHTETRARRASVRPSAPPSAGSQRTAAGCVSSPVPARASSSAMRVAVGHGNIKGTAVRAGIVWFAENYGEPGLSRVLELATPELASMLRPNDPAFGIIASGWYDTQLVGELLGLLERVASPADTVAFGAKVANAIAKDNVGGVYRALFRLIASPQLLEANSQRVWRTYVDEGTLTVKLRDKGSFEARARGWTRHHADVCRMLRAMIESLLRAIGYNGLVVERSQCVAQGDPMCIFDGNWMA